MSLLPSQILYPGKAAVAWRRQFDNLVAAKAVDRLWAKDVTLWRGPEGQKRSIGGNLHWLDLPDQIRAHEVRAAHLAAATKQEGFQDVVLIAMGDSNLAAETLLNTRAEKRYGKVFLLESTDPSAIRAVDKQLDYRKTQFVVASKSGKRIETHALLLYFLNRLKAQGAANPGRCFVAVTEPDSYLSVLAKNY